MYEVQLRMLHGWENCWQIDGAPMVFRCRACAQAEIDDHLESLRAAGMQAEASEYRIVEVASMR